MLPVLKARHLLPRDLLIVARLYAFGLTVILSACAAPVGGGFNQTTPINRLDESKFASQSIKNMVVTHVNLGSPSRNYLAKRADFVDKRVTSYLKRNGYNVIPPREFSQRWRNALSIYGNPTDPTTGRVNSRTFIRIMQSVRDQMVTQTKVDAFVFTDLLEKNIYFSSGINRVARWDGVTRKPTTQGPGDGVSVGFDWGRSVAASTIRINIFDTDLNRLFTGDGGLSLSEAIDTRSGVTFVRRKKILENESFIDEGIAIALHPLIKMNNWPGVQ